MSLKVTVSVDSAGNVTASPDPLDVGKSNGNVVIDFDVATPGWEITDVIGLPDSEFSGRQKNGNGYKITDKNDNTNSYSYNIALSHTESGQTLMHDPTIRNGGRN